MDDRQSTKIQNHKERNFKALRALRAIITAHDCHLGELEPEDWDCVMNWCGDIMKALDHLYELDALSKEKYLKHYDSVESVYEDCKKIEERRNVHGVDPVGDFEQNVDVISILRDVSGRLSLVV